MARIAIENRLQRVLKFQMSILHPQVAELLGARGFDEQARAEGWSLLDQATGRTRSLPAHQGYTPISKRLLADIDAWENTWFDVADAALARAYPQVHAQLFLNLSKASDLTVVLNVRTFLSRLAELASSTQPATVAALALLEKRGLTDSCRAQALALLNQIQTEQPDPAAVPDDSAARAAQALALEALWAWYKDWAKTARTVVTNKRLRILMGISQPSAARADEIVDDDLDAAEDAAEPAGSVPALA